MPVGNPLFLVIVAMLCACSSTESDRKGAIGGSGGAGADAGTGAGSANGGGHMNGGTSAGGTSNGGANGGSTTAGGTSNGGADGGSSGSALGGASMGGGSGGTEPDGGAGSSTGAIGIVGTSCSPPGALACAGNYQKLTVVCGGDGTWQPNETCESGEFCDSTTGPNAGICQPQLPECAAGPGTRFCRDRETAIECGLDTVTMTTESCNCWLGECVAEDTDPCPEPGHFADAASCASDCGLVGCFSEDDCPASVPVLTELPAVFRASQELVSDSCRPCTDSDLRPNLVAVAAQSRPVRVSVLPPWRIGEYRLTSQLELVCAATVQCLILRAEANAVVTVVSDDPQATPRNVLLELVEPGVECP